MLSLLEMAAPGHMTPVRTLTAEDEVPFTQPAGRNGEGKLAPGGPA